MERSDMGSPQADPKGSAEGRWQPGTLSNRKP